MRWIEWDMWVWGLAQEMDRMLVTVSCYSLFFPMVDITHACDKFYSLHDKEKWDVAAKINDDQVSDMNWRRPNAFNECLPHTASHWS